MYTFRRHSGMTDIERERWNRLTLPLTSPFMEWEWLALLEASGSIAPEHGWTPRHLTMWDGQRMVAAAALYRKSHSWGEFVFDFVWADVADQLGIPYYPKLVGVIPATPYAGYRILTDPEYGEDELIRSMLARIDEEVENDGLHSSNLLFLEPAMRPYVREFGYIEWLHQSYEWRNPGYADFEEYLADFTKNQRRNIRRERRKMEEQEIAIRCYEGNEIPAAYFALMYRYYRITNDKFGPYAARFLNRRFFLELPEYVSSRLLFICAFLPGERLPVGMSMLVKKGDILVGRYWGAERFVDGLHFNLCYYAPIEWAIEHGYRSFDPGMGSPHKVRRGFQASSNHSAHKPADPRLHYVMRANMGTVNEWEQANIDELNAALPFKRQKRDHLHRD
jgi:predicted N-acyltransferase